MSLTPDHIGTDKIYRDWCRNIPNIENIQACEVKYSRVEKISYDKHPVDSKYLVRFVMSDGTRFTREMTVEEFNNEIRFTTL